MFKLFAQWRDRKILANREFSVTDWQLAAEQIPVLGNLNENELLKLFDLSSLFLHSKDITGASEFEITDAVRQSIALQACLPILNLGLDWYAGWSTIIVYPKTFSRESTTIDEFGVAHTSSHNLSGEAWVRGPVVLSWQASEHAGERDGHNVIIHEFVHKLDMLNGRANGFPPMQSDMSPSRWSALMGNAFEDFQAHPKQGLDRYGATNPAEFFAVLAEVFFETPTALNKAYPELYELMTHFFKQEPLSALRRNDN